MKKILVILLAVVCVVLAISTIHFAKEKGLKEDELLEEKSNIEKLRKKVTELEGQLEEVQHFDNDAVIQSGYADGATNYTGEVLESQIDGDFEGWEGETIFKLTNGTIWQQASYDYTYHYAYMPHVIIYGKDGTYYMKVEDVEDVIAVKRLR